MNVILTHVRMVPHVMTQVNGYTCDCYAGYTGTDCQTGKLYDSLLHNF